MTATDDTSPERGPEEVRADIDQTRDELGATVTALASKADVKARASAKVEETKAKVAESASEAKAKVEHAGEAQVAAARSKPWIPGGVAAALIAGAVAFWLIRR